MIRNNLTAWLLLACVMIAGLDRVCPAPPVPEEPGAVFFHQGDNALSWDNDELQRVRDLHIKDFSDKEVFLKAPSMASYLGLTPVEALHMAVPLHVVFVGFQGDGNMGVNVTAEELQGWFGHLDHILPHTRVELAELTCAEDGHCAGLVHGRRPPPTPVPSYVHLNFSCNVVVVKRKAVMEAFERAIHAFSRPVDPEIEMGAQQVDATKMEGFVDNFLSSLGLGANTYTLLVINPTWTIAEPLYGYRAGMSQAELDILVGQADKVLKLMNEHYDPEPQPTQPHSGGNSWRGNGGSNMRSATAKFGVRDATWSSDAWVASITEYLKEEEHYKKDMMTRVGPQKGAAAIAQAVRLLRRPGCALGRVLREELVAPPESAVNIFSRFRTAHPAEDCQVGNWVGSGRWAYVDLTAGGFDWGPALGGDGVVHRHTMPSVLDRFSALHSLRSAARNASKTDADHELSAEVERMRGKRVSQSTNRAYAAFLMDIGRRRRGKWHAPGEKPQAASPDEHGGVKKHDPMSDPEEEQRWQRKYKEATLRAELDVYEELARNRCAGGIGPGAACAELKEAALATRRALAKLASSQATPGDIFPEHGWDLFGDAGHVGLDGPLGHAVISEEQRAHDLFMAELAAVMSRALRHVVAPPTATWTHAAGYLHDTATPFARKVTFNIYVVTESTRKLEFVSPIGAGQGFDVAAYRQAVETLRLSSQEFEFKLNRLSLHDDPVLAAAFAAAQRTALLEIPTGDEMMQETERLYVDSRALAHVLRQRFDTEAHAPPPPHSTDPGSLEAAAERRARRRAGAAASPKRYREGADGHFHHEVPVFVFELDREVAVLLDAHYNAKALEDMILVVTNAAREDEHPTGMMCGGALVPRPLSPLKEALGATLTHLGGILPPHLGYNPTKHRVTHDWLWSVGTHPQSFTSVGARYTDFQRDALGRSYLLDGLDSAVDAVNAGIAALAATPPSALVYEHLQTNKGAARELLSLMGEMVDAWRKVMESAWSLDWGTATEHLAYIEDAALKFKHLAEMLSTIPLGGQCQGLVRPKTEHLVFPTLIASACLAGGALLYLLWPLLFGSGPSKSRGRGGYGYIN